MIYRLPLCDCLCVYVSVCICMHVQMHVLYIQYVPGCACKKKKKKNLLLHLLLNCLLLLFLSSSSPRAYSELHIVSYHHSGLILSRFCISVKLMCRFRVNPCDNQACLSGALWFDWCGWVILTQLRYESKVANQMGRGGTGPGLAHTWHRYTAQSWRQINCRHRSRMQVECVYLKYYLTSAE